MMLLKNQQNNLQIRNSVRSYEQPQRDMSIIVRLKA